MFANQSSTVLEDREILKYAICRYCEKLEECDQNDGMPIISPLSRYIIQYLVEINNGFHQYPLEGSWENQPQWFIDQLNIARKTQANKEREERERYNSEIASDLRRRR